MSKKLILFLMVLLFGSTSFLRADELTVCDGTETNSYVPVYGLYVDAYLRCQYVMPAASLADMDGGTINSMRFALSSPASEAWTGIFQVYMMEVAYTEIAAFEDVAGATTVYTGTLDGTGSEMTVTFSTPYEYNGGNLLVGFDCITTGNYKSASFYGVTATGASVQGYSYSALASITPTQRNFLPKTTFVYEAGAPVPPIPTGDLTITPIPFELGFRPTNGWTEPYAVRINNGGEPVSVTATLSNTSGVEAFSMSSEINNLQLATGDEFAFTIGINPDAADGDYTEEFTMFSVNRDITTVPVTATFYTAGPADIVETAENIALSYTSGVANFSKTPTDLHANYFGYNNVTALDAVYEFNLTTDSKFTVNGGTFIGIYNKVSDFHPTAAIEPVLMSYNGSITEGILLAGQYYMLVAGDNITTIEGTVEQIPAPEALTALAPADGATGLEGNIVLTWEGGANATQYQVLFGTSPVNMPAVLDWTMVDDNFGSFDVSSLVQSNTQYFWQIKAKNSKGTVQTARRGFTSALTTPNTVTASEEEIFTDGTTLIRWKHSSGMMGDLDEIQIGSGTATSSYLPTYNLYNYSLTEQIYTSDELGGTAGYINSISFYPVGAITRNLQIYVANTDKESFSSGSDWVAMTDENLVYAGNVAMVANTWVTVNFNEPFEYEGGNLILAVNDLTGTWTSSISYNVFNAADQAINIYQDTAPYSATAPSGSGTVRAFKNQIIINKDGAKDATANRTFQYYNVYYGDVKANTEPIYEKQYLLGNLPYNMVPGHNVSVTAVYDEGESALSNPVVVKVSGYGTFTGTVTELISGDPVAGVTVKFNGKDEFDNNVSFEGTTNNNGVYTITAKAGNYRGTATLDGMEPNVSESVTLAYQGTETVDFVIHEVYKPVMSVLATEVDPSLAKVQWSVNYAISGGGTGGTASTFYVDFEDSAMPEGWTTIDANNDGYDWVLGTQIGGIYLVSGASLEGTGHNASIDMICSGSFSNATGQAITPDNYLVSPQVNLANGSTFSFWACGQDASYVAEHFGVFVSDNGTSDWTMVQEWTMTAKESGKVMSIGRNGNTRAQGSWHQYTVDLSAFAGQKYIAIRHFNCNDMFILDVDDIELSVNTKDNRDVETYAVYRKAILKETELTDADSVFFGTVADTLYADFDWNNVETGLYQYGVSAIYPTPGAKGNRDEIVIGDPTSTTTNSYLPTYSLYEYSLTQQIYTADEIGMAGTINTLTMWLKNTSSYARNINVYMKEADITTFASGSAWVSMTDADMVGSFTLATGISNPVETAIALNTPFNYSGTGNLVICFQDVTGSWSSGAASVVMTGNGNQAIYAYRDNTVYNPTNPGVTGTPITQKSVIKLDLTPNGGGGNDNPVTPITWSNVLPKNMETTVTVNAIVAAGSAEGATVIMTNTFENLAYTATLDETGTVTFADFRKGEYVVTVDLEGYVSNYAQTEVSIWDETVINATLTEICKPVDVLNVSGTGYATWTPVVPVDRVAEKYFVQLNGVFYGETTDNVLQFEGLEEGETYTAGVAVVYTTGMSAYVTKSFTYIGCEGVATQVEELAATNEPGDMNVILTWNGAQPTPPTPPTGDVTVKLTVGDVWGDGSGYQMLLDDTHSLYGTTIPTSGALSMNCSGNEGIYSQFSHKIPTNADGNCSTSNIVLNNSIEITIPAGTYDWCITNPTPGDRIWIASNQGNVGGRQDDYVFEGGKIYEFTVTMMGSNDATNVTITDGKNAIVPHYTPVAQNEGDVRVKTNVETAILSSVGTAKTVETRDNRDYLQYCTETFAGGVGTGGSAVYWGIAFTPAQLAEYDGMSLTKVGVFVDIDGDYGWTYSGNYTVNVYQGGTSAPSTLVSTVTEYLPGDMAWHDVELPAAVTIDASQPLWLCFYTPDIAYPMSGCNYVGQTNSDWLSLDGVTWEHAADYSLSYTWMIRGLVENGGGTPTANIVPNKFNIFVDGEIVGTSSTATFTYEAPDFNEHEYTVMWVSANYDMSCPATIIYAAQPLSVDENNIVSAIYPNPTSGDLHVNATAMKHISIVNAMGQMVYSQDVEGNETVINMAQFESGIYMVSIITENGSSVKRVTVVK